MASDGRPTRSTEPDAGQGPGVRVVVTGASGNVGTSVLEVLQDDPQIPSVVGLCRRAPAEWRPSKVEWVAADVADDPLEPVFDGADAVVNLAWLFQPTHDELVTWRNNVLGGIRVFDAVAATGVPALVHASSVGAYAPGPDDVAVDESWPTHALPTAAYGREKSYLERHLDAYEHRHPSVRVVRSGPASPSRSRRQRSSDASSAGRSSRAASPDPA